MAIAKAIAILIFVPLVVNSKLRQPGSGAEGHASNLLVVRFIPFAHPGHFGTLIS
jgi:hypothetical protein